MTDDVQPSRPRIVVGVDGSEGSKAALAWAVRQAELTGAPLLAVMSWHVPTAAYGAPVPGPTGWDFAPGAQKALDEAIQKVLVDHPDLDVSGAALEGHPAPTLLQAAAGAELLVVGSRGHGGFTGLLLGSVSEHCVAHATCPVVVVHPTAGRPAQS